MVTKFFFQQRAYFENCTISDFYNPDGEKIGYALEDVARPVGVKIDAKTCIPEGVYDVEVTFSNRFQKLMIQIFNADRMTVERDGVKFKGVRVHGGNTVDNTEGCPLIAKNFDGDETVWGSLSKEVTAQVQAYLAQGYRVQWIITRK